MRVPGISVPTAAGSISLTADIAGGKTVIVLQTVEHKEVVLGSMAPEDAAALGRDLQRLAQLGGEPGETTAPGSTSAFIPGS